MYTEVNGDGPPVLMLHGAGVSGWMWKPTRNLLDPAIKTIVPDLPGFGHSAGQPCVSHQATVRELAGILDRYAPQGAHVAGFSMGAQLAILLAAELPHLVRSVLVISAESKPAPLPGPTLALLGLAAPLSRQRRFATAQARQLGIPEHLLNEYLHDSTTTTRRTLVSSVGENIRFTLPPAWSDYSGQATVLVGVKERRLMHDSAQLTVSALPGSVLKTVESASHDIPLSQPGTVAATLHRHIANFSQHAATD